MCFSITWLDIVLRHFHLSWRKINLDLHIFDLQILLFVLQYGSHINLSLGIIFQKAQHFVEVKFGLRLMTGAERRKRKRNEEEEEERGRGIRSGVGVK